MSRCDEWNDEKIDRAIELLVRSLGVLSGHADRTGSLLQDISRFLEEA